MIRAFNKWYDALQEPWRFLTAMSLIMVGIVTVSAGGLTACFGAIWLVALLLIRMFGR